MHRRLFRALASLVSGAARGLKRRRSSLLEFAGFILLSVAAWQVDVAWGLAAAGVSCVVMGYAAGGSK